jgi:SAM-dependent methyltransferase
MLASGAMPISELPPSAWVVRFLPLISAGGLVLDIAAGAGRHVRLLRERRFAVCAIDRDIAGLRELEGPRCEIRQVDLESAAEVALGGPYDGIVVANYLHRPLLPALERALAPGGILIYETFAVGNGRFGRPRDPDFLLRPGELLAAFSRLTVIAYEAGEVGRPRRAVIERIAAVNGPLGRLPEAGDLDSESARTAAARNSTTWQPTRSGNTRSSSRSSAASISTPAARRAGSTKS